MTPRRDLLLGAAAILLAASSTGCLSIHTVDVGEGFARHTVEPGDPVERLERPITVYVVCGARLGGVVQETRDHEQAVRHGSYRTELFPLEPGEEPRPQIEARAKQVEGVLFGVEVEGFADTLGRLLHRRLSERFERVEVRVVRSLDSDQGIVVVTPEAEAFLEVIPTSEKQAFVRLKAQIDEGRAALVKGEGARHAHRAHLIWAVPATLVAGVGFGPPGLVAVQFGIGSLERQVLEEALVQGIDDAARKLAQKLAEEPERPVPLDLGGFGP